MFLHFRLVYKNVQEKDLERPDLVGLWKSIFRISKQTLAELVNQC